MKKSFEYLGVLQDYYAQYKTLPSYSVIADLLGFKSKGAVLYVASKLKAMNYIEMSPDNRLKPGPKFFDRSFSNNSVQAGLPRSVDSDTTDNLNVDMHLVNKPSLTVMITVKGDSMRDVGILDGDIVVVEKNQSANIGNIVVAVIDGEFTLKTLGKENGKLILIPANPDFPIIRPSENLEIFGVVVGQFRKY